MKKTISILLIALMTLSVVSCGDITIIIQNGLNSTSSNQTTTTSSVSDTTTTNNSNEPSNDPSTDETLEYSDSLELLNKVFTEYNVNATEETMLYVAGGNPENFDTVSFDSPAKFVALENSNYNSHLGYPESELSKLEEASSMFNMMNTNIFNCYTIKLTGGTDVNALTNTLKDNILARQWFCGKPDKLYIIKCPGNYLLVVWGITTINEGVADIFVDSVLATVDGSSIVVEENIVD